MRKQSPWLFIVTLTIVLGSTPAWAQADRRQMEESVNGSSGQVKAPLQQVRRPYHKQSYVAELGSRDRRVQAGDRLRLLVHAGNVPWFRLHISDYYLGEKSYLTITALRDGQQQRLDARTLPQWRKATGFFNGDTVEVRLHVVSNEEGIFVHFAELTVGEWVGEQRTMGPQTLCGQDNRVASTDARVGRLFGGGCTAWLVSNGALLTAGHCADFDPDDGGPQLPDGTLDLNGVVEFNVPASMVNGTPVMADMDDQYPIDLTSVVWNFDGSGQGLGKDWAVFACMPNSNTGLLPHQAQGGFFRMTSESPAASNTIRVTGYGVDNTPPGTTGGGNAQNYTNQTATGPYVGESGSGTNFWHEYQVDTMGANSGSPVIWNSNGYAIGIHTNGGCTASGGQNSGTSFEHNALENALQNFPGNNTLYVDGVTLAGVMENGTIFRPFNTVTEAVTAAATGATVSIVAGTYNDQMLTINKPMTLRAPVGTVTIGQ